MLLVPQGKPVHERKLAIVAMGGSNRDYMNYNFDKKNPENIADEIWTVNSAAFIFKSDAAIMMDDAKDLEERRPEYIQRVKNELGDLPILTSRAYPDYPNMVQYPLAEILTKFQFRYLNGSVAYGLAYALWAGYKNIMLYGCDYMYDNKPAIYESGRGCVEFWIAIGSVICGANIAVAQHSSLMDSNKSGFYGYREQPRFKTSKAENGDVLLTFREWIVEEPKDGEAKVSNASVPSGGG